ncbi:unnamed protein product [Cyclocybe aegerita]|uniref:Uncharacterized protein n=1 Tax=Cyclocybe aegerita TaxID=1973307 RepID=A0A8S0W5Z9_CYCAE|nr:unnamed protein product [Cyclocybe aegerita]
MAALRSPSTPSNISSQSKKGVFSSSSSSRRSSTSSGAIVNSSPHIPLGIGYSPGPINTPTTPAGSGIPAFRTLRSLLPFGPGKNATPISTSASPNTSRSPFSNFGSVRRSMTRERERKSSLSNDAMSPVIAIGPVPDESAIRRSVSLPRLEKPLPSEPLFEDSPNAFQHGSSALGSAFILRTPSPGPALSAELSTIIEADSSGVSKHGLLGVISQEPSSSSHSKQSSTSQTDYGTEDDDADNSALDLSTSHLADQVRHAMLESNVSPNTVKQWHDGDKEVVIIDADEHPEADTTFALESADPELLALLSPNAVSKPGATQSNQPSPTTPTFPSSSTSRLPRSRQSLSLLPRPRASNSPSPSPISRHFPTSTPSPTSTTATTSALATPKPSSAKDGSPATTAANGSDYSPTSSPAPSSPCLASASSSTPARRRTLGLARPARMFGHSASASLSQPRTNTFATPGKAGEESAQVSMMNGSRLATRTLRQVMLGGSTRKSPKNDESSSPSLEAARPRGSLDSRRLPSNANDIGLGRPSLEVRRGASFDSRRPSTAYNSRSSTSPERTDRTTPEADSSPSPEATHQEAHFRPSLDSSRPSFDSSHRPGSSTRLREKERHNTPSLRVIDASGDSTNRSVSPIPRGPPPNRIRKRSMSVQERFGKGRYPGAVAEQGIARPGSSLSVHGGRASRGGLGVDGGATPNEFGSGGSGPKLEWLGPRTAKAFRAAGLLDFDREKEKERDNSGEAFERSRERGGSISGMLAPSPLGASVSSGSVSSALNRFASLRSASEYNPTPSRAHSRMAFSDVGGGSGRRGSGTFSAYGSSSAYGGMSTYGQPGLMESPTFTVSSSSRDRDTPKSSTSTAPTSVSESFGYLGRDRVERERERERDEFRELKEKHATEMAALLGALSDSQRTARVLREENAELRERLDRFAGVVQQNNELHQACGEMQQECSDLRRQCVDLRRELAAVKTFKSPSGLVPSWSGNSTSSGFRTPLPRPGNSSPLANDVTPRYDEEEYNDTMIIHDDLDDRSQDTPRRQTDRQDHEHDAGPLDAINPSSSSTPSLKRRLSGASSVFPIPPANMTMLLHDDAASQLGDSNRSSADHSQYPFFVPPLSYPSSSTKPIPTSKANTNSHVRSLSRSPPANYQSFAASGGHKANKSIASAVSISPTTANFSMVTGSPGSLSLRPEHELLLGDMESLDLGVRGLDLEADLVRANSDEW